MKPNFSAVAAVESTLEGENVAMGFDPGAMEHIMAILSEVYSDPTAAVAREYTTNAMDSHIEAGQTRPVEITTPSVWQPNLIIQDFGVGMDASDIRNIYANYGASTKRHSDAYNGMLGIGSKSAFAYSNSFTVTGVKNGVRTVVAVSRDDRGRGVMTILSETPTTDGNGVTITIPVSNIQEMTGAVNEFGRYLPQGKVLVNGADPSQRDKWTLIVSDVEDDEGNVIISNIWQVSAGQGFYTRNQSRIIMGNVAYEPITPVIAECLQELGTYNTYIIAEVPVGGVVFAPSREKLRDTPLTRRVEKAIADAYSKNIASAMCREIENADTPYEAFSRANATGGIIRKAGMDVPQYKGKDVPDAWTVIAGQKGWRPDARLVAWMMGGYGGANAEQCITMSSVAGVNGVIVNAPDDGLTATNRRKARTLINGKMLILPERTKISDEHLYWLPKKEFIDFEDVKAVRLPRASSSTGTGTGLSTKGKHFIFDNGRYSLGVVPDDADIRYVVKSEVIKDWNSTLVGRRTIDDAEFLKFSARLSEALPDDALLIHVYANRVDRLKKDYPLAKGLTESDVAAILEAHATKDITDDDIKAYASWSCFNGYDSLSHIPDADDDKEYARFYITHDRTKVSNALTVVEPGGDFATKVEREVESARGLLNKLLARYPLLGVSHYYINNTVNEEAVKRYFMADFNKYQEEK